MNKTTQHTPGPWRISGCQLGQKLLIEHGDEETLSPIIGSVYEDGGRLPRSANANLIAAAPAMYEALLQVRTALFTLADNAGDVPEWNEGGELYELSHTVKAALAQAEGRQA